MAPCASPVCNALAISCLCSGVIALANSSALANCVTRFWNCRGLKGGGNFESRPYFCLISSTGVVQKSAMWPVLPHLKHSRATNAASMSMGTGPLLFAAGADAGRETDPPHGMKAGGLRQLLLLLRGAGLDAFDLGVADWLPARP